MSLSINSDIHPDCSVSMVLMSRLFLPITIHAAIAAVPGNWG
jgi:hypothetical protein